MCLVMNSMVFREERMLYQLMISEQDWYREPNVWYAGRSKGCAIVEYASIEDAQRAIQELNDTSLMNRMVFVREDREVVPGGGGGGGGGVCTYLHICIHNIY